MQMQSLILYQLFFISCIVLFLTGFATQSRVCALKLRKKRITSVQEFIQESVKH